MAEYRIEDLPGDIGPHIVINPETGCWEWQGRTNAGGYGMVRRSHRDAGVHCVAYSLLVGPIPPGLVADHVWDKGCRSHACCWPEHLEPVTRAENSRRGQRAVLARRRATGVRRAESAGATARWATEALRDLDALLDEIEGSGKPVMLFRWDTPAGVLVPAGWYEQARAALAMEAAR